MADASGMQQTAGEQCEAQRMYQQGFGAVVLDKKYQQQRQRDILREIGVHAHGASQLGIAAVTDRHAVAPPHADRANAQCHKDQARHGGIDGGDGHHDGSCGAGLMPLILCWSLCRSSELAGDGDVAHHRLRRVVVRCAGACRKKPGVVSIAGLQIGAQFPGMGDHGLAEAYAFG